jgi:selenocysteine-specific elongation factor
VAALVRESGLDLSDVIAVSSVKLTGIAQLREAIGRIAATVVKRSGEDLFRMPVDRAFTVKGTGTVVTGTVWSGTIERDATLIVQPGNRVSRVRAIQSHDKSIARAEPGMRAANAMTDCDVSDVPRGCVLVSDAGWVATQAFDATLSLTNGFKPTPRTRVRIHVGTSETGGRFGALRREGVTTYARVILEEPLIARGGDRFVIRLPSPARTVGGGRVLDPYPPTKRRVRPKVSSATESGSVAHLLESAAAEGLSISAIPVRTGLDPKSSQRELANADATVVSNRA